MTIPTDDIGTIVGILGLSAVGLATIAVNIYRFVRKKIYDQVDKKQLGKDYDHFLEKARSHGAFDPKRDVRLWKVVEQREKQIYEKLLLAINEDLELRLTRRAPGSTVKKLSDVCGSGYVEPKFEKMPDRFSGSNITDEKPILLSQITFHNLVVVGRAGTGKTIMSLRLARQATLNGQSPICVINFEDFSNGQAPNHLKSLFDLATYLGMKYHIAESPLEFSILSNLISSKVRFIIDGLDEISRSISKSNMEDFLSSWLFQNAIVVCARETYFQSNLAEDPTIENKSVLRILELEEQAITPAIETIFKSFELEDQASLLNTLIQLREDFESVKEITRNPLVLTMFVELGDGLSGVYDIATLYERFISIACEKDISRNSLSLDSNSLVSILKDLAWQLFKLEERNADSGQFLSRENMRRAASRVAPRIAYEDLQEVLKNSALMISAPLKTSQAPDRWVFIHRSFEDFLVAKRFYDWLVEDSAHGGDFTMYLETPDVSYYLKELFQRIVQESTFQIRACRRLHEKLRKLIADQDASSDLLEKTSLNFQAGQAAYHLGIIANEDSRIYLQSLVQSTEEFWIRRAAAIGLAFSGAGSSLNNLIDEMRSKATDGDLELVQQNIGIELGFYGDQEFDPQNPYVDLGSPSCGELVGTIAKELNLDIEAPNWRMCLFNLVCLSKYRPCSLDSFKTELEEYKPLLINALSQLENEPAMAVAPEVQELRSLLIE